MIHQIQFVKTKTEPLPQINRGLIQARHIQARLNGRVDDVISRTGRLFWNPDSTGSYVAPVSRWTE